MTFAAFISTYLLEFSHMIEIDFVVKYSYVTISTVQLNYN